MTTFSWLAEMMCWHRLADGREEIEFALSDLMARSSSSESTWLPAFLSWRTRQFSARGVWYDTGDVRDVSGIPIVRITRDHRESAFFQQLLNGHDPSSSA